MFGGGGEEAGKKNNGVLCWGGGGGGRVKRPCRMDIENDATLGNRHSLRHCHAKRQENEERRCLLARMEKKKDKDMLPAEKSNDGRTF